MTQVQMRLPLVDVINPDTWEIEPALLLAQNKRYPDTFRVKPLSELNPTDYFNGHVDNAWWAVDELWFEKTDKTVTLSIEESRRLQKLPADQWFHTFWEVV